MPPLVVVLTRHTESEFNRDGKYTGQLDPNLTEKGIQQAERLGEMMKQGEYRFASVYCSALHRSIHTAVLITRAMGTECIISRDPRLNEACVGRMEGMTKEEAIEAFPHKRHRTHTPDFDFTDIGGESEAQVFGRYEAAFSSIQTECATREGVLVVGHGTALRVWMRRRNIRSEFAQGGFTVIILE